VIVSVHQPHFLPWLGYLERMKQADLFIVLDHVQFERQNYQNRTRILLDGQAHWLTVPVVHNSQQERIIDKEINNPEKPEIRHWGEKNYQKIYQAYRKAPFFNAHAPHLKKILAARWERLVDLNQELLEYLREQLGITTPLVNSSELMVDGRQSELILNLCRAVAADTLLIGMGGSRRYLDYAAFAKAGIKIIGQEFEHPQYVQCGGNDFVRGLSAIDLLFNHGPESREILQNGALLAPEL
jgi:hypothetical protein